MRVSGYDSHNFSKYSKVKGITPDNQLHPTQPQSQLLFLPNIVKLLPAPVIPQAKTVELIPFITLSMMGTTASLKISMLLLFQLKTPSSWNMCYLALPSLRQIVDPSIIETAFLLAPQLIQVSFKGLHLAQTRNVSIFCLKIQNNDILYQCQQYLNQGQQGNQVNNKKIKERNCNYKNKAEKMDREKQEAKLKQLCKNNKKLLQSISTHLINNPDQLQGKLHQHRYLQQKYGELIGFSRENVERNQKLQTTLSIKDEEINKLNKILADLKQQASTKIEQVQRDYRRKKIKDEEELTNCRLENNCLKKELGEMKQKYLSQKKQLQQSHHVTTQTLYQYQKQIEHYKINQQSLEGKVKELETQCHEQKQKLKKLSEENIKLSRNKKKEQLEEIKACINNFKKRDRDTSD